MSGFWSGLWGRLRGGDGPEDPVVEGFIGRRLSKLETSHDFFRFFHFESTGVEKTYDDGDRVMAFKPGGPAFRDLVTLHAWVTRGTVIRTMRLTVRRSFIDDAATCVYAADLYNSFLRSVGEASAGDAIDAFAREITARSMERSARPVITSAGLLRVEGAPSEAYRAYVGEREAANVTYGSGKLRLVARNGDGEFEILVWAVE